MLKIFYVLINRNNIEYLKEDNTTSYKLEEAVKFNYAKDAILYRDEHIESAYKENYLVFKVEVEYTLERVDTDILEEYIKMERGEAR